MPPSVVFGLPRDLAPIHFPCARTSFRLMGCGLGTWLWSLPRGESRTPAAHSTHSRREQTSSRYLHRLGGGILTLEVRPKKRPQIPAESSQPASEPVSRRLGRHLRESDQLQKIPGPPPGHTWGGNPYALSTAQTPDEHSHEWRGDQIAKLMMLPGSITET